MAEAQPSDAPRADASDGRALGQLDETQLREEVLRLRDELIRADAQLGDARGQVRVLEAELTRYRDAAAQLDALTGSPAWRLHEIYRRMRRVAARGRDGLRRTLR